MLKRYGSGFTVPRNLLIQQSTNFSEISKFVSGKIYTDSMLVVLEFTQAGDLGIYTAVCARVMNFAAICLVFMQGKACVVILHKLVYAVEIPDKCCPAGSFESVLGFVCSSVT